MEDFQLHHWALLDLQYSYLDDGFRIVATTDVPCHLYLRMTTTPPRQHALPSRRRGTFLQGDIRFCFDVYEDNEQDEAGDTFIHTWNKAAWPVYETRWFYCVGKIAGYFVVSESCIFKFHFPAPPPEPPPPIERVIFASFHNRALWASHGNWAPTHDSPTGGIHPWYALPNAKIISGDRQTASYFIYRGFLDFDTSIMPDTAKLLAASFVPYVTDIFFNTPARPWLYLTNGHQTLPPLPADYGGQLPYTGVLGKVDVGTLALNAYNEIPLNSAGLAFVNLQGNTLFCLRGQNDVENYASLPVYNNMIFFHSAQSGLPYLPYLKISYYPA